jgi:hypothetical protein
MKSFNMFLRMFSFLGFLYGAVFLSFPALYFVGNDLPRKDLVPWFLGIGLALVVPSLFYMLYWEPKKYKQEQVEIRDKVLEILSATSPAPASSLLELVNAAQRSDLRLRDFIREMNDLQDQGYIKAVDVPYTINGYELFELCYEIV